MNSLYNQLNQNQVNQTNEQIPNNIQQIVDIAKNNSNPQQFIMNMANQNPQFAQMLNIMKTNNITPKQMFMGLANQMGVNPMNIIQLFK